MNIFDWKWKSRDGLELYARGWKPEAPKAVVVLVHGHGEHVNRYNHVADAFTKAGYAMQGFDLRGHGQSAGQRGHTPNYESLMNDITDFIGDAQGVTPACPSSFMGIAWAATRRLIMFCARRRD